MEKICEVCGKTFTAKQSERAKYCNNSCRAKASNNRSKGLGIIAPIKIDSLTHADPLLLEQNSTYAGYGANVPRFLFEEKVRFIDTLQNKLRTVMDQFQALQTEHQNLKVEKQIDDKMRKLEADTPQPSALGGVVTNMIGTPEGMAMLGNLLSTFLSKGNTPTAIPGTPTATDNIYLQSIVTEFNKLSSQQMQYKVAQVAVTLMQPASSQILEELYNKILNQAA